MPPPLRAVRSFWQELANNGPLISIILLLAGAVGAALPTMRTNLVEPQEYDEFAYLLGAETFLTGRLANPPHPLAPFFETMHVLQQPTYASKYPPGQSLQLAAGALLGHPIFGVWVTVGLLALAAAWILRAVAPATWAAAGGLLAAWQWVALTYWGRTYWGGSLFALAGMLVLGGALRFGRKPAASSALWAGLGAGLMALTRPYEGLWFCLVPAGAMLARLVLSARLGESRMKLLGWSAAAAAPVAVALAFLLIYNKAVTGDALLFPHRLYQETVAPDVSVFVWEQPGPAPANRNPELSYQMRRFNPPAMLAPTANYAALLSEHVKNVLPRFAGFFLPGLFGLGALWALGSGSAWREQSGRLALASLATFFVMLGTLRFFGFPHYAAAWCAPLAVLIMLGFRGLCAWRWRGRSVPPEVIAVALYGWALVTLFQQTARGDPPHPWVLDRLKVIEQLEQKSVLDRRDHVVFVMMAEGQPDFAEWVYNGPTIDDQTVIFARSLGAARDAEVAKYYPTRHLWQAWLNTHGEIAKFTAYDPTKTSLPVKPSP